MRILVDLDSTVADLFTPWLAAYTALHPDDPLTPADMVDYDATTVAKYPDDIYLPFNAPGFYLQLQFLPGAKDALLALRAEGHELFIATAPSREPGTAADKLRWIRQNLPFIRGDHVMLGAAKYLLKADALIDDSPRIVDDYRKAWGFRPWIGGIQFPYNRGRPGWDCLAPSWEDTKAAWEKLLGYFTTNARRS